MKKIHFTFRLFLIFSFFSICSGQTINVDATLVGRQQLIDGFGACTYFSTPVTQTWYKDLYFNDAECSIVRMDMTPAFKAPYSDNLYNSSSGVRPYTNATDYTAIFNGNSAQIAVMTPDINTNINFFEYNNTQSWSQSGGIMGQTGEARKAALGDFKLTGSIWSPAPWLKISSGNTNTIGGNVYNLPCINGANFVGGKLDVSNTPLPVFFDGVQNTSALTQYARSVAAWIRGFQNFYNLKFYAFSIQNELGFETDYNSSYFPKSSQYIAAAVAIRRELDKYPDLKDIKIMGPEDLLSDDTYSLHNYGPATDKNLLLIENIQADTASARAVSFFNTHGYDANGVSSAGANPTMWDRYANGWGASIAPGIPANVNGFRNYNKKSWMTETSGEGTAWLDNGSGTFPGSGAFGVALNVYQALTTGYQSGYVYWQMGDGGGATSTFSLTNNTDRTSSAKYIAFKHYSKFIRPNAVRLNTTLTGSTAKISSTAFIHDANKTLTYILLNSDNATRSVTVNIPTGLAFALTTLAGYRSSNGSLWQTSNYTISGGFVTVSMPAYSIVTLYGKGSSDLNINPSSGFSLSSAAQVANLSITGSISWNIAKTASPWLILSTASGFANKTVGMTVSLNTGAARIATVTVSGIGSAYTFTVSQASADVSLTGYTFTTPSNIINTQSGSLQFGVVPTPSNASPISYLWSVNQPSLASINASGLLTALSDGIIIVSSTATGASGVKFIDTKNITISGQGLGPNTIFKDRIISTFDGNRFIGSSTLTTFYTTSGGQTINVASNNMLSVSGTGSWGEFTIVHLNGNLNTNPPGITITGRPYVTLTVKNPNAFPVYTLVNPVTALYTTATHGEAQGFSIPAGATLTKTLNINTTSGSGLIGNVKALQIHYFENTDGSWWDNTFNGSMTLDNISVGFKPRLDLEYQHLF